MKEEELAKSEAIARARREKMKRLLEAEEAKQANIGGFKEEQKKIFDEKQGDSSKYAKYMD